ncbi:MAG: tRNA (adenosine(37)-N6)-threonylcarbamoyltransferase complex dimerization subunit type 1 TsaB [Deltaproteobacteria bacterium]|nr:tRNA (adenosine(37)-N6)-threonylcarbamoyltransferase complex dimerization subunit type 1 TsaB [Deltaproteobacteria bacterium]
MILAVNTTTRQFGLALMDMRGTVLAEYIILPKEKNFGGFMPAVNALMEYVNVGMEEIQTIAVAIGPGSFTGMRVGLAMAKGMTQGLNIPLIGVSSLEALARQVLYVNYPVCPIIDSRKGEVFTALFHWSDDDEMIRIREDTCLRIEDLASMVTETTIVLGNDFNRQSPLIKEALGAEAVLAQAHLWNLRASAVGTLGLKRFLAQDFDDAQDLVPIYLRPPDIRPNPYASQSAKSGGQ